MSTTGRQRPRLGADPEIAAKVAQLPACLRQAKRWLLWKPDKQPRYVDGTPRRGKLDQDQDRGALCTLEQALDALPRGGYAGIGFALGPDGTGNHWQGIDLDDVEDHGLQGVADALPGYVEMSPSGKGYHALGYGTAFRSLGANDSGIEAYSAGRYFTITGDCVGVVADPVCLAAFVAEWLAPLHKGKATALARGAGSDLLQSVVEPMRGAGIPDWLPGALAALSAEEYVPWLAVGMALHHGGSGGDAWLALWDKWSQPSGKYKPGECAAKWVGFRLDVDNPVTLKHVWAMATAAGWVPPASGLRPAEETLRAEAFMEECYPNERLLWTYAGDWRMDDGTQYNLVKESAILGALKSWLAPGIASKATPPVRLEATGRREDETMKALGRLERWSIKAEAQHWRVGVAARGALEYDPRDIIVCRNGLLHLPTRTLLPRKGFYNTTALPHNYIPGAKPNAVFDAFLHGLWDGDKEMEQLLLMMLGYLATGGTGKRVFFVVVGPTASGKTRIVKLAQALVGDRATVVVSLDSLAKPFGQACLIDAKLAVVNEAQTMARDTSSKLVTNILKENSGDGPVAYARKYKEDWQGEATARFLLTSNEIPQFRDASGVVSERCVVVPMPRTFKGKQDPRLVERMTEGDGWAGILNRALAAKEALDALGYFPRPALAEQLRQDLMEEATPLVGFVSDRLQVVQGAEATSEALYDAYRQWCEATGQAPSNKIHFLRSLIKVLPEGVEHRNTNGARRLVGARVRTHAAAYWSGAPTEGARHHAEPLPH